MEFETSAMKRSNWLYFESLHGLQPQTTLAGSVCFCSAQPLTELRTHQEIWFFLVVPFTLAPFSFLSLYIYGADIFHLVFNTSASLHIFISICTASVSFHWLYMVIVVLFGHTPLHSPPSSETKKKTHIHITLRWPSLGGATFTASKVIGELFPGMFVTEED